MKRLVALALCGALAAPAVAFAADPAPAAPAAAAVPASTKAAVDKKDRQVCKTIGEPGSRLGGKRVCRSQAQWNELAAQQRQEMDRKLSIGPARAAN